MHKNRNLDKFIITYSTGWANFFKCSFYFLEIKNNSFGRRISICVWKKNRKLNREFDVQSHLSLRLHRVIGKNKHKQGKHTQNEVVSKFFRFVLSVCLWCAYINSMKNPMIETQLTIKLIRLYAELSRKKMLHCSFR